MVKFDRDTTEIIFFDLEWYVQKEQRVSTGGSLIANPNKKGQKLLGGVFTKFHPLKENIQNIKYDHFWLWQTKNHEKTLVEKIYNYIKAEWKPLEGKHWSQADLILCGQGISRFDVPILYIRSTHFGIDKAETIFEILFKTKQVDLSNVAISYTMDNVMYPASWNDISKKLGYKRLKESGASVWDMYDAKNTRAIEKRTEQEVKDCVKLYEYILKNKNKG